MLLLRSPSPPAGYFSTILRGPENSFCGSTFELSRAGLASNMSKYSAQIRNTEIIYCNINQEKDNLVLKIQYKIRLFTTQDFEAVDWIIISVEPYSGIAWVIILTVEVLKFSNREDI